LLITAMAINVSMEVIIDTGEYMSKYLKPYCHLKHLTTNLTFILVNSAINFHLALYLSIEWLTFIFLLKIHLWPHDLLLDGKSISSHVWLWLFIIDSILLLTIFFQYKALGHDIVSD
jgi:hypothetical protein